MNKKILIIITILIAAIVIPLGLYAISPLFTSNTVNESLSSTAANISNNTALHDYQKFVSMNDQDRMNAAKQMSQRQKNMVMIGAGQINNTVIENVDIPTTIKQQEQQSNATTTTTSKIMTGYFIGAGDGFHNAEGSAKVIPLGDGNTILRL